LGQRRFHLHFGIGDIGTMSVFSGKLWRWRLARTLGRIAVARRENLVIPDGLDGSIQLRCALLRPDGLYVVDILEGSGQLIAGDVLPEWTEVMNRGRFRFPNPLPALQREQAAVQLLAGRAPVAGLLLLQDGLRLARAKPRAIVSLAELVGQLPALGANSAVRTDCRQAWDRLIAAAQ
ncbi:MAG: hypothetical protein ACRESR_06670, partial [Gammaproteobacteria bacterium]